MEFTNKFATRHTILVAKSGGDWQTLEQAIDASVAGDVILIYADGDVGYSENNPLTMKDRTSIEAVGGPCRINIMCQNTGAAQHGIIVGSSCHVTGVKVSGATGAGAAGYHFPAGKSNTELVDIETSNCDIGVLSDSSGPLNLIRGMSVASGSGSAIIQANAGGFIGCTDVFANAASSSIRGLVADGAGAFILAHNSFLAGWAGGITDAIYADAGGTIRCNLVVIDQGPTNALRTGPTAVASTIDGSVVDVLSSGDFDVLMEHATGTIEVASGRIDSTKVSQAAGSVFRGYYDEGFAQDKGTSIAGELHVGSPQQPAETVLGEGDSTVLDMIILTTDATGTGNITDITANLVDGTAQALFQGTGAGHICYIGNTSRQFPGWKEVVSTAMVLGAGTVVVEMWSGAAWIPIDVMSADAVSPYASHQQEVLQQAQTSQVRFDPAFTTWAATTIGGTLANWIRLRIIAGITTIPVLNDGAATQKLHTNRYEINADGNTERFGTSIEERPIELGAQNAFTAAGAPSNQAIAVSAGITYNGVRNGFAKGDGNVYLPTVPFGLDTSRELTVTVQFMPSNTNTADLVLDLIVTSIDTGDALGALIEQTITRTITPGGVADVAQTLVEFTFRIPNIGPGETLVIALQRNAGDAFTGRMDLLNISLKGFFYTS